LIWLIESVGRVMKRGIPGHVCGFDVTRLDTDLVIGIARRRCCSCSLLQIGRGPDSMVGGDSTVDFRLVLPDASRAEQKL
jgi:hypothetical protein